MNEKALERARRGAAWLDKMLGPGWRRKIKRRRLDMSIGRYGECGCILAQLYDDYRKGAVEVGIADPYGRRADALGFFSLTSSIPFEDLTEAWRQVLREGATV